MIFLLLLILWYLLGIFALIQIMAKTADVTVGDLKPIMLLAFAGPLVWPLVYYSDNKTAIRTWRRDLGAKVIFKKRGSDD